MSVIDNSKLFLPRYRSYRGRLIIASCASALELARNINKVYQDGIESKNSRKKFQKLIDPPIDKQFLDGEVVVRLDEHVRGADAYLIANLNDHDLNGSVNDNLQAFLDGIRAFKQYGAAHVTGVIPYHIYARQDKATNRKREPITVGLIARQIIEAGASQIVTWHPHCELQGYYGTTMVDSLDALSLFHNEFSRFKGRSDVILVAPDAGAFKFVVELADKLNLASAVAAKVRPQPGTAKISYILGEFTDKRIAIVIDDMIDSAGTMFALIQRLATEYPQIEEFYIGASHNLCQEPAFERLSSLCTDYRLMGVTVTNSIPQTQKFLGLPNFHVRCLSKQLALVINRIHYDESVSVLSEIE